jgi:hypothetical protein
MAVVYASAVIRGGGGIGPPPEVTPLATQTGTAQVGTGAGVTNFISNPRAEGAVVGVVGSGGALPTLGWGNSVLGGATLQVIGTGTDTSTGLALPYIDIRVSGANSSTGYVAFYFDTNGAPAQSNDTYTVSAWMALVGGTLTNVTSSWLQIRYAGTGGVAYVPFTPTATLTRYTFTASNNAAPWVAGGAVAAVEINSPLNSAIDYTIRFACPQLEPGAGASSIILPPAGSPARATRPLEALSWPIPAEVPPNSVPYIAAGAGKQNWVANPYFIGAVNGVIGSGGAYPTGWSNASSPGLSFQIIGTGTDPTINLPYIDIRIYGTNTANNYFIIYFGAVAGTCPVVAGDLWTESFYCSMTAGSMTNITNLAVNIRGNVNAPSNIFTPTATLTRYVQNATILANNTIIVPCFAGTIIRNAPIDITVRLAAPQLERVSLSSPMYPPAGTIAFAVRPLEALSGLVANQNALILAGAAIEALSYLTGYDSARFSGAGLFNAQGDLIRYGIAPPNIVEYIQASGNVTALSGLLNNQLPAAFLGGGGKTNYIANPLGVGAVTGIIGVGGVWPTGWSTSASLLSYQIVGTGTDTSTGNALPYVDVRIYGNDGSNGFWLIYLSFSGVTAAPTENWAGSVWLAMTAGSMANLTTIYVSTRYAGGANDAPVTPTATLTRYSSLATLGPSAIGVSFALWAPQTLTGNPIDITLRIAAPQLEHTSVSSAILPPPGTTGFSTRALEVLNGLAANQNALITGSVGKTNFVRNPRAEGAVAGVVGSGGTLPTDWLVATLAGGNVQIIGTGIDMSTGGAVPYVDVRFYGNLSGTGYYQILYFDGYLTASSQPTDTWTASVYCALLAGSLTNITNVNVQVRCYPSGTFNVGYFTPTATLTRYSAFCPFIGASATAAQAALGLTIVSNQPYDITLRVAGPQLELGNGASSLILPPVGVPGFSSRGIEALSFPIAYGVTPPDITAFIGNAGAGKQNFAINPAANNAVVGVIGSGGAWPTGWSTATSTGLSYQVIGSGIDPTINLPYLDFRVFGTDTANTYFILYFGPQGGNCPVVAGDAWVESLWCAMTAGSMTNITTAVVSLRYSFQVINSYFQPTATLTRYVNNTIAPANSTICVPTFGINFTQNQPIDITFRLAGPQLEAVSVTSAFYPPAGTTGYGVRALEVLNGLVANQSALISAGAALTVLSGLVANQTALITGTATLTAIDTLGMVASPGTLSATGSVSVNAARILAAQIPMLSAAGTVSVTGAEKLVSAVIPLTVTGAVSVSAPLIFAAVPIILSAQGGVTAQAVQYVLAQGSVTVTGQGTVSVSAVANVPGQAGATVSGLGSVTITPSAFLLASVNTITAQGNVTAGASRNLVAGTSIAGTGSVGASSFQYFAYPAGSTISGLGNVTASAAQRWSVNPATISAAGAVGIGTGLILPASVIGMSATGSVPVNAAPSLPSALLIQGTGAVTVGVNTRSFITVPAIAGTGSVAAAAQRLVFGSVVTMSAQGAVTAAASSLRQAGAAMSAAGACSASAFLIAAPSIQINGVGSCVGGGLIPGQVYLNINGAGTVSVSVGAIFGAYAPAVIVGQGSVAVQAVSYLPVSVIPAGATGNVQVSANITALGVSTVPGQGSVGVRADRVQFTLPLQLSAAGGVSVQAVARCLAGTYPINGQGYAVAGSIKDYLYYGVVLPITVQGSVGVQAYAPKTYDAGAVIPVAGHGSIGIQAYAPRTYPAGAAFPITAAGTVNVNATVPQHWFASVVPMSATGAVHAAAQYEEEWTASVRIAGAGAVTVHPAPVTGVARIAAQGAVAVASSVIRVAQGSVLIAGQGAVTLTAWSIRFADPLLQGQGTLIARGRLTQSAAVRVQGAGAVSVKPAPMVGTVHISGQGSVQAAATKVEHASVSIAAHGSVGVSTAPAYGASVRIAAHGGVQVQHLMFTLGVQVQITGQGRVRPTVHWFAHDWILIHGQGSVTLRTRIDFSDQDAGLGVILPPVLRGVVLPARQTVIDLTPELFAFPQARKKELV